MTNVCESKSKLYPSLQTAITLELSTIPTYLTSLLSIKPEANRVAANIIMSVIMEEMLHMTLAGNLLASLGGKMEFGPNTIPRYPLTLEFEGKKFRDREFDINLDRFSQESIATFMKIELPSDFVVGDQKVMEAAEITVPGITIGAFYDNVKLELEVLCAKYSEKEVFSGDPKHQIDENYYWSGGGKPVVITDLTTAKEALDVIVSQGEGATGTLYDGDKHYFNQPAEVAHFFRFNEISFGRRYQPGDKAKEPPTGEQFAVDYDKVYPIKANARSTDYQNDSKMADLNLNFNRNYTLMLTQIAESF